MGLDPWLCLVTDRRRLAQAVGAADTEWASLLHAQVAGAVRARIPLVQIRERDLEAAALVRITRALVELTRESATRILVNDRVDVALAAGAAGAQLRSDSPCPQRMRRLVPAPFMLGRSVHSVPEAESTRDADFLIAGTMFPTISKADKQNWLGVAGISAIVAASGGVPVLAIGGITEEKMPQVAATGARGLASIGAFLPSGPGDDIEQTVIRQAGRLRQQFR